MIFFSLPSLMTQLGKGSVILLNWKTISVQRSARSNPLNNLFLWPTPVHRGTGGISDI